MQWGSNNTIFRKILCKPPRHLIRTPYNGVLASPQKWCSIRTTTEKDTKRQYSTPHMKRVSRWHPKKNRDCLQEAPKVVMCLVLYLAMIC